MNLERTTIKGTFIRPILLLLLCVISCIISIFALYCVIHYGREIFPFKRELKIAGGPKLMTFHNVALGLEKALESKFKVKIINTNGAEDNMKKLCRNEVDIGFVHAGIIPKCDGIKMITNVFVSTLHIITSNPAIKKITDITNNTKIVIGPDGSGTAILSKKLLDFYCIDDPNIVSVKNFQEAQDSLLQNRVEVVFLIGGIPLDFVKKITTDNERYYFVSIPNPVALQRVFHYIQEDKIPFGVYGGRKLLPKNDISTISVNTVLLASPKFSSKTNSNSIIQDIVNLILKNRQELLNLHPATMFLDRKFAVSSTTYQMHPGANIKEPSNENIMSFLKKYLGLAMSILTLSITLSGAVISFKRYKWHNKVLKPTLLKTFELLEELQKLNLPKEKIISIYNQLIKLKDNLLISTAEYGFDVDKTKSVRDVLTEAIRRAKDPMKID